MNRRNLLAGLSGGAVLPLAIHIGSSSALAQPASPHVPMNPIGNDEYKRLTLAAGSLAKQSSELATQKAENARVKQFAGFEVAEQTAIAQALTSQLKPSDAALDDNQAAVLKDL